MARRGVDPLPGPAHHHRRRRGLGRRRQRHISVFHRFFSRAPWSLDALGRVLFTLALAWVPADQPLLVLVDDTLARKHGKSISLATMHHDPLLVYRQEAVLQLRARLGRARAVGPAALGRWARLRAAAPVPPVCWRQARRRAAARCRGRARRPATRRRRRAHAAHPRPTKLELARELIAWWRSGPARGRLPGGRQRLCQPVLLEDRPPHVHLLSRLRRTPPCGRGRRRRRPGQKAARGAAGPASQLCRSDAPTVAAGPPAPHALWPCGDARLGPRPPCGITPSAPPDPPRRGPRPDRRRRDEAFFCTDLTWTRRSS